MHYSPINVAKLFQVIPYLTLSRVESAKCFLQQIVNDGEELSIVLQQYPFLKYEPLDFYYTSIQVANSVNKDLIEDLVNEYGWRGAVVAAWMILLKPDKCLTLPLSLLSNLPKINRWIVDLAILEVEGKMSPCQDSADIQNLMKKIRSFIGTFSGQGFAIKRLPENFNNKDLSERVKLAIRNEGVNEANRLIKEVL